MRGGSTMKGAMMDMLSHTTKSQEICSACGRSCWRERWLNAVVIASEILGEPFKLKEEMANWA